MNIKDALAFGERQLKKVDGAALDASILLCETVKKPKEYLYTHPEKKLTPAQIAKYKNFIRRRAQHEPVAYITGKKEFYGFEFLVSPDVLIPRPDTETLISAVLSTVGSETPYSYPQIIDVGTGSGAIAITLKKILPASTRLNRGEPKARVFASDISPAALAMARKNAKRLNAKIIFKKGDLLETFLSHPASILPSKEGRRNAITLSPSLEGERPEGQRGCVLIITANLPYLSRAEWQKTAPEIKKYEPYGALVGGKTGTEIYKKLFEEISSSLWKREVGRDLLLNPPQSSFSEGGRMSLFIEIGHNQKTAIEKLARKILNPRKIEFIKDLAGKWRVAKISLTK